MAYLNEKLKQLEEALKTWEEILTEPYSEIVRDATIQRFEYCFELLWKTVKLYLLEKESIECHSPKSCFREARLPLKIDPKVIEDCLQMSIDRNLSVHTYSKKMADDLYEKVKAHYKSAKTVFDKLNS
ncbi:nucleotidyltransferase substrate binding protein [Patescibacteria group bacterium]|nr:nucleotidyltransferase substrate binding protein [Patescibacteria group bacterium]